MAKDVQARLARIGRPLRLELALDGAWVDRLRQVLCEMGSDGRPYSLQRYLEELVEADIVYREGHAVRGPYVQREEIARWLRRRHEGTAPRRAAAGTVQR